jgi:hypothetical protein
MYAGTQANLLEFLLTLAFSFKNSSVFKILVHNYRKYVKPTWWAALKMLAKAVQTVQNHVLAPSTFWDIDHDYEQSTHAWASSYKLRLPDMAISYSQRSLKKFEVPGRGEPAGKRQFCTYLLYIPDFSTWWYQIIKIALFGLG